MSLWCALWLSVSLGQGNVALVVGENRGLLVEESLRFAEDDAARMKQTLVEVSHFLPENVLELRGANESLLRESLKQLAAQMDVKAPDQLFIYVSSHANDTALHLAGTEFPLSELVSFVKNSKAKVAILVIDACRSGSVTRLKGLKPAAPEIPKVDATTLEGRIFISASGADEYAQESDELKGSTFTHHFITGLRGAADVSRDNKVTLEELYSWAWNRTIESTFGTKAGTQRPAFSIDLHGQGQLVMSTLESKNSKIQFANETPHQSIKWLVIDDASNQLVAQLDQQKESISLAVSPGKYRVKLSRENQVSEKIILVSNGQLALVSSDAFSPGSFATIALKGGPQSSVAISISGGGNTPLLNGLGLTPLLQFKFRRDAHLLGPINQLGISAGAHFGSALDFSQVEMELLASLAHRFIFPALNVAVGIALGPMLVHQTIVRNQTERTSLGLSSQFQLELRLPLAVSFEMTAQIFGGGALIKVVDGLRFSPRAGLHLGVVYAW
jgi:hypothetical protein